MGYDGLEEVINRNRNVKGNTMYLYIATIGKVVTKSLPNCSLDVIQGHDVNLTIHRKSIFLVQRWGSTRNRQLCHFSIRFET